MFKLTDGPLLDALLEMMKADDKSEWEKMNVKFTYLVAKLGDRVHYGRGEFQQYLRMPMKDIPASRRCVEINQCVACHHRAWAAECPN